VRPFHVSRVVAVRILARLLLLAVFMLALRGALTEWHQFPDYQSNSDFSAYFTAAWLVRTHQSPEIYRGVGSKVDPNFIDADPNSVFGRMAKNLGYSGTGLYNYPPTFADMLLPLTLLPTRTALIVWTILNFAALLFISVLLARRLDMPAPAAASLIFVLLLFYRPTVSCLIYGQVAILLLLLLLGGFELYARGHTSTAALLFVLAVGIKLTPLIAMMFFVARRDWRMLRWITLWSAMFLAALMSIHGPAVLELYFLRYLPLVGAQNVYLENRGLTNSLQVLITRRDAGVLLPVYAQIGKVLSLLSLAAVGWFSRRTQDDIEPSRDGFEPFALFLLLCCSLSPVAWLHAYVLALPAVVLAARRAWQGSIRIFELVSFALFVLSITANRFMSLPYLVPMFCLLFVFTQLSSLKSSQASHGVTPVGVLP
jgi:hypothetical protein